MPHVDVPQDDVDGAEGRETPDLNISPPMLNLFVKYHRCKTVRERHDVCLQIAQQFSAEYDSTEQDATEEWHAFFEAYARAEMAFEQAAIKLSRLAIHHITEEATRQNMTIADVAQTVDQAARVSN